MSELKRGDRIYHTTTGRMGNVLSAGGDKPWQTGDVKVWLDGDSLALDTRAVFCAPASDCGWDVDGPDNSVGIFGYLAMHCDAEAQPFEHDPETFRCVKCGATMTVSDPMYNLEGEDA